MNAYWLKLRIAIGIPTLCTFMFLALAGDPPVIEDKISVSAPNMAAHVDRVRGDLLTNYIQKSVGYRMIQVFQNNGLAPRRADRTVDQVALEALFRRGEVKLSNWNSAQGTATFEVTDPRGEAVRALFLAEAAGQIVPVNADIAPAITGQVRVIGEDLFLKFGPGLKFTPQKPLFGIKGELNLSEINITRSALVYKFESSGPNRHSTALELKLR